MKSSASIETIGIMNSRLSLIFALKLIFIINSFAFQADTIQHWKVHLDNRFQFVQGEVMSMFGGSAGYCWGSKENEVTLGYSWLNKNGRQALDWIAQEKPLPSGDSYQRIDQFKFISVGYWHHFHDSRRWRFGVPVEVGYGQGVFRDFSINQKGESFNSLKQNVIPVHIAGYGEWKTTKWVGAGLQVGYRRYVNGAQPFADMHGLFYRVRITGYLQGFRDWSDFLFRKKKLNSPFY